MAAIKEMLTKVAARVFSAIGRGGRGFGGRGGGGRGFGGRGGGGRGFGGRQAVLTKNEFKLVTDLKGRPKRVVPNSYLSEMNNEISVVETKNSIPKNSLIKDNEVALSKSGSAPVSPKTAKGGSPKKMKKSKDAESNYGNPKEIPKTTAGSYLTLDSKIAAKPMDSMEKESTMALLKDGSAPLSPKKAKGCSPMKMKSPKAKTTLNESEQINSEDPVKIISPMDSSLTDESWKAKTTLNESEQITSEDPVKIISPMDSSLTDKIKFEKNGDVKPKTWDQKCSNILKEGEVAVSLAERFNTLLVKGTVVLGAISMTATSFMDKCGELVDLATEVVVSVKSRVSDSLAKPEVEPDVNSSPKIDKEPPAVSSTESTEPVPVEHPNESSGMGDADVSDSWLLSLLKSFFGGD